MSTRALHENVRMVELPIPYKERSGRSKLSVVHDGLRFFKSIVWTALTYNPVRIFGGVGAALLLLGLLVGGLPLLAHLAGNQSDWPFPRFFGALVLVVAGITLYTTGTSFSYIVALFHKRPIRQGLLGPRGNGRKIEKHYWWLGLLAIWRRGPVCGGGAVQPDRPPSNGASWFVPVASALMVLTGVQLVSAWGLARVLGELSLRDGLVAQDLDVSNQRRRVRACGWMSSNRTPHYSREWASSYWSNKLSTKRGDAHCNAINLEQSGNKQGWSRRDFYRSSAFVASAALAAIVTGARGAMPDPQANPKRIYLAPDDHTDYYWTAGGATFQQAFLDMLDYYLDRCDSPADEPPEHQSRWNCDGSFWLWTYEQNKSPRIRAPDQSTP